jgi:hypothetical protein
MNDKNVESSDLARALKDNYGDRLLSIYENVEVETISGFAQRYTVVVIKKEEPIPRGMNPNETLFWDFDDASFMFEFPGYLSLEQTESILQLLENERGEGVKEGREELAKELRELLQVGEFADE